MVMGNSIVSSMAASSSHHTAMLATKAHTPPASTKLLAVRAAASPAAPEACTTVPVAAEVRDATAATAAAALREAALASIKYAPVRLVKVPTRAPKRTTSTTLVRSEHTRKSTDSTPIHSVNQPKPALKACVSMPAEDGAPSGAYVANAAKEGVRVAAKERKKAPKVVKKMEGNVFPRNHSPSPARIWRRPPKK